MGATRENLGRAQSPPYGVSTFAAQFDLPLQAGSLAQLMHDCRAGRISIPVERSAVKEVS
jgi:hypothetical protein